ncbi:MAG TPA: hypothetical protein VIV11_18300 [Kofleriaceae bacterium]
MRGLPVLALIAACGPGPRDDDLPDPIDLPPGVWEPAPGPDHHLVRVAASDGALWWVYVESTVIDELEDLYEHHTWLTQTTATGEVLIEPTLVDPTSIPGLPSIGAQGDTVLVAITPNYGVPMYTRVFDREGVAATPLPLAVELVANDHVVPPSGEAALAVSPTGRMRVVTAFSGATGDGEVAIVDLDDMGAPLATTFVGTADEAYKLRVAAAVRSDDAVVVAWDRVYEQCSGPRPAVTVSTAISSTVEPLSNIGDMPERGELEPAIASIDDTQYVAWVANNYDAATRIALARYPDVTAPLATFGTLGGWNTEPYVALASPDRGAVAWHVRDAMSAHDSVHVASFEVIAGVARVSSPRAIEPVGESVRSLRGLVHVGDERYVVAWDEDTTVDRARTFAMQLDLSADERQRGVADLPPPFDGRVPARRSRIPCSH